MKILTVTNMYPGKNKNNAMQGIFVEEQVESIKKVGDFEVDVFVIEGFRSKFAYLFSLISVVRKISRDRYDLVHYHFGISACSAPLVRVLTPAAVVITFHGSDVMRGGIMRGLSMLFSRFSNLSIVVNDEMKNVVASFSNNCCVIPCAVNERLFSESGDGDRSRCGEKMVIFPSSPLREEKDYPLFKQTIAILRDKYGLRVAEKHIDGLTRSEVKVLLDEADCLLMTSKREGSPQSVKEAMAMNLPVVSVDVGDVRNLLTGCEGSAIVSGRDPEILASEVARILATGVRSKGREKLRQLQCFSGDVARRICRMYDDLIPTRSRRINN
ncbi:Glycosyltransferase involved in cell wall biosynthesis [Paraburkholderia unamae]|uniref:glycosyltransferase n=1 Tax=Paraburkholderia unamae TaxID=219649 RepID=UPI001CB0D672|nr:glycosyltransferase [Paraburkholderia unamae]CAG9270789.1 Glycosyltransferase involved in cell wall biosynthesis [Paraburkholderia unamae]